MVKIGLLSDTHGYWDEKYLHYFSECDEIWHVGDIGSMEVVEKLSAFKPLRAVYGNIDGQDIRRLYPQTLRFKVGGAEVLMKHIGGYPGKYDPSIAGSIFTRPPGAAGKYGFHKVRTLVRFVIDEGNFKDLEVIELAD